MPKTRQEIVCEQLFGCDYKKIKPQTKFEKWLVAVKKEQKHYPLFRAVELNRDLLKELFNENKTPVEALNDLSTVT
jgi:hypothetical protein